MLTKPLPGLAVEIPRDGCQNHSLKHIGIVDLELLPDSPALRYSQGEPSRTPCKQHNCTVHTRDRAGFACLTSLYD